MSTPTVIQPRPDAAQPLAAVARAHRAMPGGSGASQRVGHRAVAPRGAPERVAETRPAEGADWTSLAACRGADPDELFVTGAAQNKVKTRCFSCVVRTECLADALDNQVEFGVWGGMTERERRALLRRRPDVRNWTALLLRARSESQGAGAPSIETLVG